MEFVGKSLALTGDALSAASDVLSVNTPEVWTVLAVETKGCGFLPDRRPPILFERHVFSKLTHCRFDICDVSNPKPGGYGPAGASQYTRLATAIAMDRQAALQSASWGMPQIMGEYFKEAGFSSVEQMVASMADSENAQLAAFVAFLKSKGLDRDLKLHNWKSLAIGYNGKDCEINQYPEKLEAQFAKFSAGPLPDLTVRTAQLYLSYAHFDPGPADGMMGAKTRKALSMFQSQRGLPQSGEADDATLAALQAVVFPQEKSDAQTTLKT